MWRYAGRRVLQMLPTLALAVLAVFFLARAMPGERDVFVSAKDFRSFSKLYEATA